MKTTIFAPLFSLLLLALATGLGCGADSAASNDANGGNDGGIPVDAQAQIDSGRNDGGIPVDAQAQIDSGQPEECNFTNCDGCCDGNVCNLDANAANCGVRGQACLPCENGLECFVGTCAPPTPSCDDSNCDGCCDGNQCLLGNTPAACGELGNTCATCTSGMTCNTTSICETAEICGQENCDGCCTGDGQCIAGPLQSVFQCGTDGLACNSCSAEAIECVSGTCVEDQPCLEFCTDGCCTAGGQCIAYSDQSPGVCGESGTCAACPVNDSCLDGMCTPGTTVWTITVKSAVLSATDENGNDWDFFGGGLADAFVTGALTNDFVIDWDTKTIDNVTTPNWDEAVDSYSESDLLAEGLEFNVLDADVLSFETIGNCIMTLTVQELQSGTKTIDCGPLVSALTIGFSIQE